MPSERLTMPGANPTFPQDTFFRVDLGVITIEG